ncbi:hypothetical protein U1Q18_017948, partial [Sarracenia purpurea var. burkii]
DVASHKQDLRTGSTDEGASTVVDNKNAVEKGGLSASEGVDDEEKTEAGAVKVGSPRENQESPADSEGESGEEDSESESKGNGAESDPEVSG